MMNMEDRDWFAIMCLVGGTMVVFFSFARILIDLNFKPVEKRPTFLWGELRSDHSKFTFMGWVVSAILSTVCTTSSLISIYYYIEPFSWWLLQASTITFFVGVFMWYDYTRWIVSHGWKRDLAAIPALLATIGAGLMVVVLVHPDTQPLDTAVQADNVAYRMTLVMLGVSFVHHLVMDLFIWYFSFAFMEVSEANVRSIDAQFAKAPGLNKKGLSKLIGSNRKTVPGHAC